MKITRILVIICTLVAACAIAAADSVEELSVFRANLEANSKFKDLKATVNVTHSNRKELEKMGKVFAEAYQFKKANVTFKSPDMLKMNGTLGMVKAEFITTGTKRIVRVPSMKLKKTEDITNEGQKQMTSLDVGVASPGIWKKYNVQLERTEMLDAGKVFVLRLTTSDSKKSQLVWITESGHKLLRRDRLHDDGKLKVRTVYSGHQEIGGVWVPVKAEVLNGDGKLAAVTETKDIVINSGVEDKEFE